MFDRKTLALCCAVLAVLCGRAAAELATPCDQELCQAPSCRCSSTNTPGDLYVGDIPHFVVLSFDDAITVTNYPYYSHLQEKLNPDGCNIKMTFFVSHENTDYTMANDLYRHGHEIAVHSVTHKADVQNYWRVLNKTQWAAEIVDQKTMLSTYGNIPADKITGFRAPFLEVGGDGMYEALKESGFEYDCSWATLLYTPWYPDASALGALWPYTLDYQSIQEQTVGTKPTASVPGMWVAPMTDLKDNRDVECAMLDACESYEDELETSAAAVTELLKSNFKAHYNTRTPFGVYVHQSWFLYDDANNVTVRKDGFENFLDYVSNFPHVYVVTVQQLIDWVKSPVPTVDLDTLPSFQCQSTLLPEECPASGHKTCSYNAPLPIDQSEIYMKICEGICPDYYPYLGNTDGKQPYPAAALKNP